AALEHRPILLGGVFRALGTADQPMATAPAAKRALGELDILRSAARAGMPIVRPDGHPRRPVLALRATLAADLPGPPKATRALFRAYWAHGYDLEQPAVVEHALSEAGLDGRALVERAADEAVKLALREATSAAVAAGVFGVPSFRVENARGTQLFWGQDR